MTPKHILRGGLRTRLKLLQPAPRPAGMHKALLRSLALASGLFVAALTLAPAAKAEAITAYTGALPPYTIAADAAAPGISHELLVEMSKRSGVEIEIKYLPWKRAQTTVLSTPNTMLFTATRTASREEQYNWIVEMAAPEEVFVTLKQPINSYDEGRALERVAIKSGTPRDKELAAQGLTNLAPVNDVSIAAKQLAAGRVTAWYTLNQRAAFVFKSEGLDPSQLVFGTPQRKLSNWLASNPEFDPEIAAKLAQALDEMRADGTYDAVLKKYLQ